jgi:hypothetical protein
MMSKTVKYVLSLLLLCACGGNVSRKGQSETAETKNVNLRYEKYDHREPYIIASPDRECGIALAEGETVTDFSLAATRPQMVALVKQANGNHCLKVWNIGESEPISIPLPAGAFKWKYVAMHPAREIFFVSGTEEALDNHQIYRVTPNEGGWEAVPIFVSPHPLERLVVSPLPFHMPVDTVWEGAYRLYAGEEYADGVYRLVSVSEYGTRLYQVVGPKESITTDEDMASEWPPSKMTASCALPVAFHPAGHRLIWEDGRHRYQVAEYWGEAWEDEYVALPVKFAGAIVPLPNGLGFVHHRAGQDGAGIYLLPLEKEETVAAGYRFASVPKPVADGKGLAGVTVSGGRCTLQYVPADIPMGDVVNAWRYVGSPEELSLFDKNSGLFRPSGMEQIYQPFEPAHYDIMPYPLLVTTDVMWEIFGAAFQGVFVVKEKEEAIPAFWAFADEAYRWLQKNDGTSPWIPVFEAITSLRTEEPNAEAEKILAENDAYSELIGEKFAYSEMKPRGHYMKSVKTGMSEDENEAEESPDMETYFRAFKYFTSIYLSRPDTLRMLNGLPASAKAQAARWINAYAWMIAPSRAPAVLDGVGNSIPSYCRYPSGQPSIFPLSWGWDNEVLFSTVHHENFPPELQMKHASGLGRGNPSGLDLAAVAGSRFADRLLEEEYSRYPNLREVINRLRNHFRAHPWTSDNIYNRWMDALAVQWADSLTSQNNAKDNNIWQTKRIQTGLASWATLRHATVLVNEKGAAEAGEGGFETLMVRSPRGSVEPDPETFAAIAGLFEAMAEHVSSVMLQQADTPEKKTLYGNIAEKLKTVAREIVQFQKMAEKVGKNEELTDEEYSAIWHIDGMVEHNFLLFNSLMRKGYSIANPDPMAKIADVMYDKTTGFQWHVAVGNAMEWNRVVPFYGRQQIVKGSIYSYYEVVSPQILDDGEWRKEVERQEFLPWIQPYVMRPTTVSRRY